MMTRLAPFALLALSAAVPAMLSAAPAPRWTAQVALSPMGGHVMGNPAAPTKLVEYVSYTCSHCAHFVAESTGPLKSGYVATGKVSVEVRNAVRDKYDLTAALIARCGGKARFMGNHEAIFANQDAWMPKIIAYDGDSAAKPTDQVAAMRDIGQKTGLYALMAKRGFTPKQLDACVADPAALKQVLAMTNHAWRELKISGTPAFTVNDKMVGSPTWDAVRAALPAAAN